MERRSTGSSRLAAGFSFSAALAIGAGGCGGMTQSGPTSANPGAAVGTAAAAAVVFAVAGGCRLQGCPYGSFCNASTGFCVAQTCAAGCPTGKVCNEGLNRCQDAPRPKTPTDALPQDNKATYLPTMH